MKGYKDTNITSKTISLSPIQITGIKKTIRTKISDNECSVLVANTAKGEGHLTQDVSKYREHHTHVWQSNTQKYQPTGGAV